MADAHLTSPDDPATAARLVAVAHALADAARGVTVPAFRSDPAVDNKAEPGAFDPVTAADRDAEAAMRALLAAQLPDHGVSGEEFPDTPSDGPWSWTLDPIDGTRAFIAGVPLWTTLIACRYESRPVIGVIDQPIVDERYVGAPDGTTLITRHGSQRLRVRACPALTEAVISTTDPVDLFTPAEAAAFEQVRRTARLARYGCDAYAYALVAAGTVDLVVEAGLKPCDTHALGPVVRGAGGVMSDWRGRPDPLEGQVVAAGDPRARDEALIALRRSAL